MRYQRILSIGGIFLGIFTILIVVFLFNQQRPIEPNITFTKTAEGIDVNKTIKEEALVEGFPSVPFYPGATLEKTSTNKIEGGQFYEGGWTVEAQVPEAIKWYMKELESTGWTVIIPPPDINQIGENTMRYAKNNMELTIHADQETDTTLEIKLVVKVFTS